MWAQLPSDATFPSRDHLFWIGYSLVISRAADSIILEPKAIWLEKELWKRRQAPASGLAQWTWAEKAFGQVPLILGLLLL